MRHLDLFSGIGGFALAARWVGWETIGFCEIDPYCQKVLRKHWPDVPIHEDIRDYDGEECSIISAGFPCQPYSRAGLRKGKDDDRSLWHETMRIVSEIRPSWVVAENVAGFIELGLDEAVSDLEAEGYGVLCTVLPACAVNAWHRRDRLFFIAHTERHIKPRQKPRSRETGRVGREFKPVSWDRSWEDALAHARGVDDGISGRMVTDRTDAIRNAIVPQIAEVIFRAINEVENNDNT